jgi:hypothetical protein
LAAVLKEDPPAPLPPTTSPALERIVARCLEKTRDARFQSARDLAFGLEYLSGTTRCRRLRRRRPPALSRTRALVGVVIGALLLAFAAVAFVTWYFSQRPVSTPEVSRSEVNLPAASSSTGAAART